MQFVLVTVTNLNLASLIFYAHCLIFYAQLCICMLRYLAPPPSVSFLMEGRTTLHKGHSKPNHFVLSASTQVCSNDGSTGSTELPFTLVQLVLSGQLDSLAPFHEAPTVCAPADSNRSEDGRLQNGSLQQYQDFEKVSQPTEGKGATLEAERSV